MHEQENIRDGRQRKKNKNKKNEKIKIKTHYF